MFKRTIMMVLLIGLLANARVGYAEVPHNLNVGDEFSFTISDYVFSDQVNGTEYMTASSPFKSGDTVEVSITNIGTASSSDDLFLGDEVTFFNITETFHGDQRYDSSTILDGWYPIVVGFAFLYQLSGFLLLDYPESAYFGAPSSTDTDPIEGTGFPYFATSNESFYIEMADEFNSSMFDLGSGFETSTATGSSEFDDSSKQFNMMVDAVVRDTNQTSAGDPVSLEILFKLDLKIDVPRSLVTSFSIEYKFSLSIGSASKLTHYKLGFVEGGGAGLDSIPYPGLLLILGSIVTVSVLLRKRR